MKAAVDCCSSFFVEKEGGVREEQGFEVQTDDTAALNASKKTRNRGAQLRISVYDWGRYKQTTPPAGPCARNDASTACTSQTSCSLAVLVALTSRVYYVLWNNDRAECATDWRAGNKNGAYTGTGQIVTW